MPLHFVSTFVLVAHWLIVIGLSLRVIARRPPVGVSLAWLAVIASAPFFGAGAYLLFGEKRLGRARAARIAGLIGPLEKWQDGLPRGADAVEPGMRDAVDPIRREAGRLLGFPALPGNGLMLLDNYAAFFDALVADLEAAQSRCRLCFYIWHEGGRAGEVVEALVRAARRGVNCQVLADAVGSGAFLRSSSAERLREAGVELTVALPTGLLRTLFIRRDLRNHRKIVVIDERVAYTGSQNLVDPRYFKQGSGVGQWVDAVVRITGPTASVLGGVFALDWAVETERPCEFPDVTADPAGRQAVQVVPSGPDLKPEAIHQLLLAAIYSARRTLVMTTPYFVPEESFLTALLSAALRGVEVTLIVPARNDSLLVRYASVAHFDKLLAAGVKIALFKGGLLHTKSLTIDGSVSIFGSVNLDMRSLWLNFEISLFVYDTVFTGTLRQLQESYLADAELLDPETWQARPAWRKFLEDTFRLAGPLL